MVVRAHNADTELATRCDAEAAGASCLDSAHIIRKTVDCCRYDQKESSEINEYKVQACSDSRALDTAGLPIEIEWTVHRCAWMNQARLLLPPGGAS